MKVAVYYNNHDVRVEDRPIPEPGEGEILVQTRASGVCVADTMEWYLTPRAPLTLGHEAAGVIAETGPGVEHLKTGDRVIVHHHVACLICEHCRRGNFTMCETFRRTHIKPGGFSEYYLASAQHVERDTLILPDQVSYEVGTLVEPLACVVHAIRRAKIQAGDRVILIGAGAIGLMFIQCLLHWGVRQLICYEIQDWRQQKAVEFGAPHVFSPFATAEEEARRVQDLFGSTGANKVIVAAKDLRAMELGIRLADKGGTVLFFATPQPDESIPLYPAYIFFNEITLTSSYSADHLDTRMALELLAGAAVSGEKLISHRFPLEQLSEAILQTAGRQGSLKCIVTFEPAGTAARVPTCQEIHAV
jgi:L-iditol 2-dehydrogenase